MTASTARHGTRMDILIVDDHTTFAELLAGALDREPDVASVDIATSVHDGVEHCLAGGPDVVVMDYHLPDGDGLAAAARILAERPGTRIIMLTGDPSPEALEEAAALGICGFLPKDGSLATMLDTLRHAQQGSMVVPPALLALPRHGQRQPAPAAAGLTPREMEVLRLLADGVDVRAASRRLGITANTGRGYVKSILVKLDAHSQLEAVATAAKLGLLPGRAHD